MIEIKSVAHEILNGNVIGILNCDRVQYNNNSDNSIYIFSGLLSIQTIQYIFSLVYCYFV